MTGYTATDTAERVRTFRRHYGLTQIDLAKLLDVTRHTVGQWENGAPMSRLARYALYYLDYRFSSDYGLASRNIDAIVDDAMRDAS